MAVNEVKVRKALGLLMASLSPDTTNEDCPAFCDLIKDARANSGMSLQAVADAMGITKSHLWDSEQGRTNPSTKFVWEICKVLPIDPLVALQSAATSYERKGAFVR